MESLILAIKFQLYLYNSSQKYAWRCVWMSAVVSVHVSWLSVSGMTVALLPDVGCREFYKNEHYLNYKVLEYAKVWIVFIAHFEARNNVILFVSTISSIDCIQECDAYYKYKDAFI